MKDYNIKNKLVFYSHKTKKYAMTHLHFQSTSKGLYMHQIIMGLFGQGRGTAYGSVDHIDRNPLNNTFANLRIATREEQQNNSRGILPGTKRNRKTKAQELPNGITQDMLPKYVTYNKECYNKEKDLWREFFRIERHPKLTVCCLSSSKSNKICISDKLLEIKEKLRRLDNDIPQEVRALPKFHTIQQFRGSPNLLYDHKSATGRFNLRMKMKDGQTLEDELVRFHAKLRKKYSNICL